MGVYIYGLVCPIEDKIMYVGKSKDVEYRLRQHIGEAQRGELSDRCEWLRRLQSQGLKPSAVILEDCGDDDEWRQREYYWIQHCRSMNPALTNNRDRAPLPRKKLKMKDEVRLSFLITVEDKLRLQRLADGSTSGNLMMLMRLIINQAKTHPTKFGLRPPPKKEGDK